MGTALAQGLLGTVILGAALTAPSPVSFQRRNGLDSGGLHMEDEIIKYLFKNLLHVFPSKYMPGGKKVHARTHRISG